MIKLYNDEHYGVIDYAINCTFEIVKKIKDCDKIFEIFKIVVKFFNTTYCRSKKYAIESTIEIINKIDD